MVIAEPGGVWMATWGGGEDDPEYVSAATIEVFEPMVHRLFAREPHRAVILDMNLGKPPGLDVLRAIKRHDSGAVVVLVSGFPGLMEEMQKGLSMDASACLTKPFEVADLIREIRQATIDRYRGRQPEA